MFGTLPGTVFKHLRYISVQFQDLPDCGKENIKLKKNRQAGNISTFPIKRISESLIIHPE